MNIIYKNYKFNKDTIAILNTIRKNVKPVFSTWSHKTQKKSIEKEILKMVKYEILIKSDEIGRPDDYILHPDFKYFYNKIDFEEIKPYPKKINEKALQALKTIAIYSPATYGQERNQETLVFAKNFRTEIPNFQSIFKNILYADDLVDICRRKTIDNNIMYENISPLIIYKSDYEPGSDLYKSQLIGYIEITDKGIKTLEDNGIFIFYTTENFFNVDYSKEKEELQSFIKLNNLEGIEIVKTLFNNNKEYQFVMKTNLKSQLRFQKLFNASELKEKINITFSKSNKY